MYISNQKTSMLSLSRLAAKVGSAFLAYFTVSLCFCRTQARVRTHTHTQSVRAEPYSCVFLMKFNPV